MIQNVHPGSGSRIQILIFYPSRIPDTGVKKTPDPGPATLVLWIWIGIPLIPDSEWQKGPKKVKNFEVSCLESWTFWRAVVFS
jgi:hypothetical protein